MPVTDLSGDDDDWLQQFMAGHAAGQAFGAYQPYGQGAVPGPYSGGPRGVMPGGGLMDRLGATPGAPSFGYPAMGQPNAQQPPAAAPGPAQGLSLSSNPVMRALNYFNPIGSAQAAEAPAGPTRAPSARIGGVDPLPLAYGNPTSQDYQNWLTSQQSAASPAASPAAPATAPPSNRGSGYGGVPPSGWGATANPLPSRPVTPTPRTAYAGQQPGAGAPTGQPSQTPTPPQGSQTSRFGMIDRMNAPATATQPGRGYQTALNLGSLFGGGGGQQPAAAPTPAVSGPLAQPGGGPMPAAAVAQYAKNYPGRLLMSPDQLATYMKTQPWLQNLGGAAGQQMTPGQLANAVRRPNWWSQFG